ELRRQHHRYGYWLRSCHADKIGELLFDGTLSALDVFDMAQLEFMYSEWRRERADDDTLLCTQLSWAATLSLFCRRFDVKPPEIPTRSTGASSYWRDVVGVQRAKAS